MVLAIDAKTGFDALQGEAPASDKRVAIDVAAMKEALEEGKGVVRLILGPQQIADRTAKDVPNGVLEQVVAEGR